MKISEVSEHYDISPDTLRYYERIGLLPPVNRTQSGIREFGETDIEWVKFIKCMRNAGLTIDLLTEYVELVQQGDRTIEARKELLISQREQLAEKINAMQETLDLLDYKIQVYEDAVLEREKEIVSRG